jgi:phosphatidylserine/phosphatidylglycerophosphate/cardiolipin synthase-like enzyme
MLRKLDMKPAAISMLVRALAAQRAQLRRVQDGVELVWTGPETAGVPTAARDAGVIAAELFARAERSVVLATYVLHNGHQVLDALAQRMDARPDLDVTVVVNVERLKNDTRDDSEITHEFRERFRSKEWPGKRLPKVYFDPRALLDVFSEGRACMHAKVVVVDSRAVLVTSANFTEAAQVRNVETGVALDDNYLAKNIEAHFAALIQQDCLVRLL